MKRINFTQQVLPHLIAVAVFFIVTLFFFKPIFFEGKALQQGDIQQWQGSAKAILDYREQTGEEGLWASGMFSGMPAYLVSVKWGHTPMAYVKKVMALFLPSPVANIYVAFISFYILLLSFRVRPYLAIAGALAFGLSTYMIIGVSAGHNGRIGAIAFMPLVIAGVHIMFTGKKWLGFGLTAAAMSLHLLENHLQVTYYLLLIIIAYGIVQLIYFLRENRAAEFVKNTALLIPAVLLGIGTFAGQLWAINEYTPYSFRGKSELVSNATEQQQSGLPKTYAFEHSNGIFEPLSLLIPDAFGGSRIQFFAQDQKSKTYQALVNSGDEKTANELAQQGSSYWGAQDITLDYYAGAIVIFLFAIGIAFAEKKYVWWLVPVTVFAIVLSWGNNFEAFNYFLFDYLPGYNKFRSVTFALVIALLAMPLLGMIGLENLFQQGINAATRKKLLIVLASTGGVCLLLLIFSGLFSYLKAGESELPAWFTKALADDRKSLFRSDAWRSLIFIVLAFLIIFFDVRNKINPIIFYVLFTGLIVLDLAIVDNRAVSSDRYARKRDVTFQPTTADREILADTSYYRVYNLQNPMNEARTSYFHNSIGGYHGAKLRRYQDLFDSSLVNETRVIYQQASSGKINFARTSTLNMLNVKYIMSGDRVIRNPSANGAAWFVLGIFPVNSPTEELKKISSIATKTIAVVDQSKFKVSNFTYDSASAITLLQHKPNYLKYESQSTGNGFAVFSEIYYSEGWKAFVDGNETPIIRADYVLRALEIPAGKHTVEFKFEPAAFYTGNKITTASAWITLVVLLGSIALAFKQKDEVA